QAEDGIRDFHVTGVQTCALPILGGGTTPHVSGPASGPTWEGPSGSPSRHAFAGTDRDPQFYGDSGTYSRFFLIPKADRADREPEIGRASRSARRSSEVVAGSLRD